MTDDLMDARLRAAGERWRAGNADSADSADVSDPVELATTPRRRRRLPWALLASAAAVVAALVVGLLVVGRSGNTPPAKGDLPLAGTVWQLAGYGGEPDQRSLSTLAIARGVLVADDSCSLLTARAHTDGSVLDVSALDVRSHNCTDAVGDGPQFDRGLALFRGRTHWTVDGRRLTLTRGGTSAHFVAAATGTPAPSADYPTLTSTDWRLVSATDAQGRQHLLDSDAAARLRLDGAKLQAGDTCNTLSGSVTITGATVTIPGLAQTEIGCPSSPVPAIVDAVLDGTVTTTVVQNTLTVQRRGAGRLDYVWEPGDEIATDPSALAGRTWTPVLIAGERATIAASLRVDAARLTGSDGCTRLDATARVTPGVMTITGVPRPASSCPAQSTTLDSFLSQPTKLWRIADGRLIIDGGGPQAFSIVFGTGTPSPRSAALEGSWTLVTIEDGATAQSASGVTLTVHAKAVSIESNCLLHTGTASATTVQIGARNEQANLCLSPVDRYLPGSFRWSITDGQLHLTKGNTTLVFART